MADNKIKLNICGNEFTIITDEDVAYTLELANDVNVKMKDLQNNDNLSIVKSAIITALEYCNDCCKAKMETDDLKNKMKVYFKEAKKLRDDYDSKIKEIEQLKEENTSLKERIVELEANGFAQTQKEPISRPVKNSNPIIVTEGSTSESADDEDSEFFVDGNKE